MKKLYHERLINVLKGTSWSSTVVVTFFAAVFLLHTEQSQATLRINNVVISQAAGAEYNSLTNNGNDALRVEIFVKMMNANGEEFKFDDVTHASQHFDMRVETVKAMNEVENGTIDFILGEKAPPPGWVQAGGQPFYYKPGPGLTPAQAIRKIETGATKSDCVGCIDACISIGWRRSLGDTKFNVLLGNEIEKLSINKDVLNVVGATDKSQKIPGDALYMDNYDYLASDGGWQGENMIYLGGDKYSGLPLFNRTESQVRVVLYNHYTQDTGRIIKNNERVSKIKFTGHSRIKIINKR